MEDKLSAFLSGEKLYGDDFSPEEIQQWYADEQEGYAGLGAKERKNYRYKYHQLNSFHGFGFIEKQTFDEVLGLGSAYGEELAPIASRVGRVTILESSEVLSGGDNILGVPCAYVKASAGGDLPFPDGKFDLITCFGVMHHIPNVTYVLGECYRCLSGQGVMLLREPINSMGDWRRPRRGLTKRERGIPLTLMDRIIRDVGFEVRRKALCDFPLVPRLAGRMGIDPYNSYGMTLFDSILSRVFSWNIKYHRTKLYEKIAPASVFYVLEKAQ